MENQDNSVDTSSFKEKELVKVLRTFSGKDDPVSQCVVLSVVLEEGQSRN